MKFKVIALRRAESDVRHIARWMAGRSTQGATAWLEAYEQLLSRLERDATIFGSAIEDETGGLHLQQAFFRTKRGHSYRVVFTIAHDQVRVLRVRGPGQPPLANDELQ